MGDSGQLVTVHVENSYVCGHESEKTAQVVPPGSDDADVMEEWWWTAVYDETGDGHGSCSQTEGSYYQATVTAAPGNPELVGKTYEWSD
jgi:hypothetical protein